MKYREALKRFESFGMFCDDYSDGCDNDCDSCRDMQNKIIDALKFADLEGYRDKLFSVSREKQIERQIPEIPYATKEEIFRMFGLRSEENE